ncbi:hypothetical protein CONCODRAFT_9016 [Conidiobolus coronatus NRRL 28638]|uniref:Uncharacterized protein n=1 Tax=Conidiobolus coronatus (strain ATCC 28846 / CBS 209.66 / NRRL 28638) TaxID=796925 RepID=A0A137P0U2_CONC2|nr:hypothetical protein CONCODRAFT_9016 [Conidiobolus coronatus NRRL 28638]|eukprot:KXN68686.1 hypothetical protein CONCODRAFT_9016 [Conidiobolus coronatus NRRL 28638]
MLSATWYRPPGIGQELRQIKLNAQFDLVSDKYDQAMKAFDVWSYRFQNFHYERVNFNIIKFDSKMTIENYIASIDNNINKLIQAVTLSNTSWYPENYNLYVNVKFTNENNDHPSFFKWTYKDFPHQITNLLQGQKAVLHSDLKLANNFHDKLKELNKIEFKPIPLFSPTPTCYLKRRVREGFNKVSIPSYIFVGEVVSTECCVCVEIVFFGLRTWTGVTFEAYHRIEGDIWWWGSGLLNFFLYKDFLMSWKGRLTLLKYRNNLNFPREIELSLCYSLSHP